MKRVMLLLCSAVASTFALSACNTPRNGAPESGLTATYAGSKTITFSGAEADAFIRALQDSGLKDTTGALGALNLTAEALNCSTPVIPNPTPRCSVSTLGESMSAPVSAAAVLNENLRSHDAVVHPDLIGALNLEAKNIRCSKVVAPSAVGECSYEVAAQDNPVDPDPIAGSVTIVGSEATKMIKALVASGVDADDDLAAEKTYSADHISCEAAVVPHPKPRCTVMLASADITNDSPASSAKVLNTILLAHGGAVDRLVVGSSLAEAFNISCKRTNPPNAPTCTFTVGQQPVSPFEDVSITGTDARALFDALKASGVTDDVAALGATTLRADVLDCTAPVVPQPKPRCTVKMMSAVSPTDAPQKAAKTIYRILVENGGAVDRTLVGASYAEGYNVSCSMPVVPNPVATCTFQVKLAP